MRVKLIGHDCPEQKWTNVTFVLYNLQLKMIFREKYYTYYFNDN